MASAATHPNKRPNRPQQQAQPQAQPAAQATAPAQATNTIPYPGAFDIGDFAKRATHSMDLIGQLLSTMGTLDAFSNQLAARSDPTIPALINSQLGNYTNFQNMGGVNANDVLSGNFSGGGAMMQPVNLGGQGGGPFDIPFQQPGGDSMTERLFQSLIGPASIDQLAQYGQGLFGMYSPIPGLRPQTNRPLPDVVAPNFDDILGKLGINQTRQAPQQAPATQTKPMQPISALPMPSFQQGTPFVPQTGPAMLHQGEAVIPAHQNPNAQTRATAPAQPAPPAANPLQQSIQFLQQQLMSGGPISPQVQNIQNQQLADTVSMGQQQALNDLRARMGGRGLGGSGLQFGIEQNIGNDAMRALTQGQNQIALDAAGRNYDALGNTANSLAGNALGAGQFGLQQAAFNMNQSQSMLDQLMQMIRNSYANPAQQAQNTTNVAFV